MSNEEIQQRLTSFKGLILDGDGVWFTGEEYRGVLPDGTPLVMKVRHHHDGQGLSFLRALGIKVLFATSEGEPLKNTTDKLNKLPSVEKGDWAPVTVLADLQKKGSKVASVEGWLTKEGLSWDECVYIGDDRTDLECMKKVGLAITPGNGLRCAKEIAHLTLTKSGGAGAIREFAEMTLDARGIQEASLSAA